MAIALSVVVVNKPTPPTAPAHEPCCHPVSSCRYRASQIASWLRDIDTLAQSGISPLEALQTTVSTRDRYNDSPASLTERSPLAAMILADLSRAFKAGKRNPQDIAHFLCPFSDICED